MPTFSAESKEASEQIPEDIAGQILLGKGEETAGVDGLTAGKVSGADLIGDAGKKTGLYAFDSIEDINIVAIPDLQGNLESAKQGCAYCQSRGDCLFLVDSPPSLKPDKVLEERSKLGSTSYGALYYPWLQIANGKEKKMGSPRRGALPASMPAPIPIVAFTKRRLESRKGSCAQCSAWNMF